MNQNTVDMNFAIGKVILVLVDMLPLHQFAITTSFTTSEFDYNQKLNCEMPPDVHVLELFDFWTQIRSQSQNEEL